MIQLKPQVAANFPEAPDTAPAQDSAPNSDWNAAMAEAVPAASAPALTGPSKTPSIKSAPGQAQGSPALKVAGPAVAKPKAIGDDDFNAMLQALAGIPVAQPKTDPTMAAVPGLSGKAADSAAAASGANATAAALAIADSDAPAKAIVASAIGARTSSAGQAGQPTLTPAITGSPAKPEAMAKLDTPARPEATSVAKLDALATAKTAASAPAPSASTAQIQAMAQAKGAAGSQAQPVKASATVATPVPALPGAAGTKAQAVPDGSAKDEGGKGAGQDSGAKDGQAKDGDAADPQANPKLIRLAGTPAAGTPAGESSAPSAAQVDNSPKAVAAASQPALPPAATADLRAGLRSLLPVPEGQTVQMKVVTQGLGEVTITLREQSGSLIATLQASTPQGQELLRGSSTQITNIFREEGQTLAKLELPASAASAGGNQLGTDARQGQDNRENPASQPKEAKDTDAAPAFNLEDFS